MSVCSVLISQFGLRVTARILGRDERGRFVAHAVEASVRMSFSQVHAAYPERAEIPAGAGPETQIKGRALGDWMERFARDEEFMPAQKEHRERRLALARAKELKRRLAAPVPVPKKVVAAESKLLSQHEVEFVNRMIELAGKVRAA